MGNAAQKTVSVAGHALQVKGVIGEGGVGWGGGPAVQQTFASVGVALGRPAHVKQSLLAPTVPLPSQVAMPMCTGRTMR